MTEFSPVMAMFVIFSIVNFAMIIDIKADQKRDIGISFGKPVFISNISCETDSMGITFNCGDSVELVKFYGRLKIGGIYVYNDTRFFNHTYTSFNSIHRFIGCVDKDCNLTLFKGDNNLAAEFVNRSKILYEVRKIVLS